MSAATQGLGVLTGLQKDFSWRSVAAAGVGATVGAAVGNMTGKGSDFAKWANLGKPGNALLSGTMAGIASGTTVSLMRGGKVDMIRVSTDAFANALGNSLVEKAVQSEAEVARYEAQVRAFDAMIAAESEVMAKEAEIHAANAMIAAEREVMEKVAEIRAADAMEAAEREAMADEEGPSNSALASKRGHHPAWPCSLAQRNEVPATPAPSAPQCGVDWSRWYVPGSGAPTQTAGPVSTMDGGYSLPDGGSAAPADSARAASDGPASRAEDGFGLTDPPDAPAHSKSTIGPADPRNLYRPEVVLGVSAGQPVSATLQVGVKALAGMDVGLTVDRWGQTYISIGEGVGVALTGQTASVTLNSVDVPLRDANDSADVHTGFDTGCQYAGLTLESGGAGVDDEGVITAKYGIGTPGQIGCSMTMTLQLPLTIPKFLLPDWWLPPVPGKR